MVSQKTALRYLPASILMVGVDQLSKVWASLAFEPGEFLPIMYGVNLTLLHNRGAAFGILSSLAWSQWILSTISVLASVFIMYWMRHTPVSEKRLSWALALILGGAVGNLIDRVFFGYVVDFIQLYAGRFYWPVFNAADTFICIGAGLLILDQLLQINKNRH